MQFIQHVSLRTKLIGMVFGVILLLGTGSYVTIKIFSKGFKDSLVESQTGLAVALSAKIEAQFYERYGDVQAFAINPVIQQMDQKNLPQLLDQYTMLYGIYDLIIVVDREGHLVGSNTKDVSGKSVDIKRLKDFDFKSQPWFQAVLSGQTTDDKGKAFSGTFFEDFILDPLAQAGFNEDRHGSSFSTAIRDSNGQIIGVISNRAGKRWFENELLVAARNLQDQGHKDIGISVANGKGLLIAEVTWTLGEGSKNVEPLEDKTKILKLTIEDEFSTAGKLAMAGGTGAELVTPIGEAQTDLIGYDFVDGPKWISSIGWTTFAHVKDSEVFGPALMAERNFLLIMSVTALMSIALSVWFGISISKNISGATKILSENTTLVTEASASIAATAVQLSESATQQAAALQETVAAVDEISAMVEKNAESANKSKAVSQESRQAAQKGRQIVENMLNSISEIDRTNGEINQQMETNNKELNEITKLIAEISSKTKVINEIVFQTKLLSFNASVEAARAGEYGKGFAVVAEEVGNLAQMSGNAAKEITSLLEESVRKVDTVATQTKIRVEKLMNESKVKVEIGTGTAKECNTALEEILVNVQNVDDLVTEIAFASAEQSTGIREISKAVGQMEHVTQQNTAVAQSSSHSSEQLKDQAMTLSSVVQGLVTIVNGKKDSTHQVATQEGKSRIIQMKKKAKVVLESTASKGRLTKSSDDVPLANDPNFKESA